MKKRKIFGLIFFWFLIASESFANTLCYLDGKVNFQSKEASIYLNFPANGKVFFYFVKEPEEIKRFYLQTDRFKIMLFSLMARMEGKLLAGDELSDPDLFLKGIATSPGVLTVSQDHPIMMAPQGVFEIRNDRFYFQFSKWAGLRSEGYIRLIPPYDIDLNFFLDNVNLIDFFSWVSMDDVIAEGEISGNIRISGFTDQIMLEGSLSSYDGRVDSFFYDYIVSEFDGIYPRIRLRRTNVAQREGVNVKITGQLDLSRNFQEFYHQFTQLQIDPFIEERDVERQWIIRRETGQGKQGETKFRYRLRKTREATGVDEADMLGIQRSIRF